MPAKTFESFIVPSGAWEEVQNLVAASSNLDEQEYDGEYPARVRAIATTLDQRLRYANPDLLSSTGLAVLEEGIRNLVHAVQEYVAPADRAAAEVSLGGRLDEAIDLLHTALPPLKDEPAAQAAVERDVAKLSSDVEDLASSIESAQASANSLVSKLEQGQIAELAGTLTQLQAQAEALTTQMATSIETAESSAATARAAMQTEFSTMLTKVTTQHEAALAGVKTAAEQQVTAAGEAADAQITHLEEQASAVDAMVAAIGGKAITGGFGEWEASERKLAGSYRLGAAATAFLAIGFLVAAENWNWFETNSNDWQESFSRIGLSVLIFALAGYLSREAAEHRMNANYARRLAIELTSIGPFIQDHLDEDDRQLIMKDFTTKVFGRAEPPSGKANGIRARRASAAFKPDDT